MEKFYSRLTKYYSDVVKVLKGEAAAASIFPNPTDKGMAREQIYAEILKEHIPSTCNVLFGGFVFSLDGSESKQMDIIITSGLNLQFNFNNKEGSGKTFSCIDGTLAIITVKSNLDSKELVDALDNIASLPNKSKGTEMSPNLEFTSYEDNCPYKIIYANSSVSGSLIMKKLTEYYKAHPDIPNSKRPNLIYIPGEYVIERLDADKFISQSGKTHKKGTYIGFKEPTGIYGLVLPTLRIQTIAFTQNHMTHPYLDLMKHLEISDSSTKL